MNESVRNQMMLMQQHAQATRTVRLEARRDEMRYADFDGVVQGTWLGIGKRGAGKVSYKKKEYTVVNMGSTSIPKGRKVSMEYRNGVYVAYW